MIPHTQTQYCTIIVNNGESLRDICLCTFNWTRSGHFDIRRPENQHSFVLRRPIRDHPQPRQPASNLRLRRACIPRYGGAILPQRRVDRFCWRVRHHSHLGDPQRFCSQERVSGAFGSDRWSPVVLWLFEDCCMWGWQGQIICPRFYVSLFSVYFILLLFLLLVNLLGLIGRNDLEWNIKHCSLHILDSGANFIVIYYLPRFIRFLIMLLYKFKIEYLKLFFLIEYFLLFSWINLVSNQHIMDDILSMWDVAWWLLTCHFHTISICIQVTTNNFGKYYIYRNYFIFKK